MLPEGPTWWVPLLSAPLALLALVAPLTQRWAAGIAMLVITSLGIATAFAAVGVWVSFSQSIPVPLWPGTGLSLAWLGALGGALVALDAGLAPRLRLGQGARRRGRVHRGRGARRPVAHLDGTRRRDHHQRTGQHASGLRRRGGPRRRGRRHDRAHSAECRRAVGARSCGAGARPSAGRRRSSSTRTEPTAQDVELAELAADLVTSSAEDVVAQLADWGISFVLLAPAAPPESDAARTMRLSASTAIDQRETLDAVGDTAKGTLWRVTSDVADRADRFRLGRHALAPDRHRAVRRRRHRPAARAADSGIAPRCTSDAARGRTPLEGGPMSDRRVFRWATTSARLLAATVASVAAVVAVVTAISVPWPTIASEPVSVWATPAPAATVIVVRRRAAHARPRPRGRSRDRASRRRRA